VNLVKELKAAGIEPLCTIFHWDLPLWVMKEGGWKSKKVIEYFSKFTRVFVDALSDQVQWWMTINEPRCFIMNCYMEGAHAPFHKDYLSLILPTRNFMQLAHSHAVKIIRKYAKLHPKVGIAMASGCFVPDDESVVQIDEAKRKTFSEGI
jgi:beta-glucosidase